MEWLASQVQALVAAVDSLFQWLVGTPDGRSTYAVTRWVFLRASGLIYLIAFVSFWVQVRGLISSQGILPAQHETKAIRDRKSTRLNSSHSQISYAVFCLKKKNHKFIPQWHPHPCAITG